MLLIRGRNTPPAPCLAEHRNTWRARLIAAILFNKGKKLLRSGADGVSGEQPLGSLPDPLRHAHTGTNLLRSSLMLGVSWGWGLRCRSATLMRSERVPWVRSDFHPSLARGAISISLHTRPRQQTHDPRNARALQAQVYENAHPRYEKS